MKRTLSTVAVALVALASTGVTATAASAAGRPSTKPAVSRADKPVTTLRSDRRIVAARRAVSSLVVRKDAALVAADQYAAGSGITDAAAVQDNVADDRAHLADLRTAAATAITLAAVRAVDAQVRQVRPEIYAVVVNGLRQAGHFQELAASNPALVSDLALEADAKEAQGHDVTTVRQLLSEAATANEAVAPHVARAIEQGIVLDALSSRSLQVEFSTDVAAAGDLLDVVATNLQEAGDSLAAMVPVTEPDSEDPVA